MNLLVLSLSLAKGSGLFRLSSFLSVVIFVFNLVVDMVISSVVGPVGGSGVGSVIANVLKSEMVFSILGLGLGSGKEIYSSVISSPTLANRLSWMLPPVAGSVVVCWSEVLDCPGSFFSWWNVNIEGRFGAVLVKI